MDEHPLISFRDGAAGRRPALMGTRLDVWQVVETVRQNENSSSEAADYLRLPVSHVDACLAYYVDYQDEVDGWIAREHAAVEQAETRAIVANNVGDFMPLVQEALQTGSGFSGVIFTSDRSLPRSPNTIGTFVQLLDDLLKRLPADDGLNGLIHLLAP